MTEATRPSTTPLVTQIDTLLAPLDRLLRAPADGARRFAGLGWNLEPHGTGAGTDDGALFAALAEARATFSDDVRRALGSDAEDESEEDESEEAGREELEPGELARELRRRLADAASSVLPRELGEELAHDLVQHVFLQHLAERAPALYEAARFVGALREERARPLPVEGTEDGAAGGDGSPPALARRDDARPTLAASHMDEVAADPFAALAPHGAVRGWSEFLRALDEPLARLRGIGADAGDELFGLRLEPDALSARSDGLPTDALELRLPLEPGFEPLLSTGRTGCRLQWPGGEPAGARRTLFEEAGFRLRSAGPPSVSAAAVSNADDGQAGATSPRIALESDEQGARLEVQGPLELTLPTPLLSTQRGAAIELTGIGRFALAPGRDAALEVRVAEARVSGVALPGGLTLHDVRVRARGLRFPLPPAPAPACELELEGELSLGGERVPVRAVRDETGFELTATGELHLGGGLRLTSLEGRPTLRLRAEERDRSREHRAEVEGLLALPHGGGEAGVALAGALELVAEGGALRVTGSSVASALEPDARLVLPGRIELSNAWVGLSPGARGGARAELRGDVHLGAARLALFEAELAFPDPADPGAVELRGHGATRDAVLFEGAHALDLSFRLEASSRTGHGSLELLDTTLGLNPVPAPPRGATAMERYELLLEGVGGPVHFGPRGFRLEASAGRLRLPDAFNAAGGPPVAELAGAPSPLVLGHHPGAHPAGTLTGTLALRGLSLDLSEEGEADAPRAEIDEAWLVFSTDAPPRIEEARGTIDLRIAGAGGEPARHLRFPFGGFGWPLAELPLGEVELARDLELALGAGFRFVVRASAPTDGRATRVAIGRDERGYARFNVEGAVELCVPRDVLHRRDRPGEELSLRARTRFTLPTAPGARARFGVGELSAHGRFRLGPPDEGLAIDGVLPGTEAALSTSGLANVFSPSPEAPFALALDGGVAFVPPGPHLALDGARLLFTGAQEPVRFVLPGFALPSEGAPLFPGQVPVPGQALIVSRADLSLGAPGDGLAARLAPDALRFAVAAELALPFGEGCGTGTLHGIEVHLRGGRPALDLGAARLAVEGFRPFPGLALAGDLELVGAADLRPGADELIFAGRLCGHLDGAEVVARVAFNPESPIELRLETALEPGAGARPAVPLVGEELVCIGAGAELAPGGAALALEGLFTPSATPGYAAVAGEARLRRDGALEHAGELLFDGFAIGDARGTFALEERARGDAALTWRADARLALGHLALGPARLRAEWPACAEELAEATRTLAARALEEGRADLVRAALGRAAEDVGEPSELRARVEELPRERALAFLAALIAHGAASQEADGLELARGVLAEAAAELAPRLRFEGTGAPRYAGLVLAGGLVPFRAEAGPEGLRARVGFDPARCIESALGSARVLARTDWAVLRAELPIDGSGLERVSRATRPSALRALTDEGLARAEHAARFELALELSPYGLRLDDARARLLAPSPTPDGVGVPELRNVHDIDEPEQLAAAFPAGGLLVHGSTALPLALAAGLPRTLVERALDPQSEPRTRLAALAKLAGRWLTPSSSTAALWLHAPAGDPGDPPRGAAGGEVRGRLLGLPLEPARVAAGPAGLTLGARAAAGSWLAGLAGDEPLELVLDQAPSLPLQDGARLVVELARRGTRGRKALQAQLRAVRTRIEEARAALEAAAGDDAALLPRRVEPDLEFLEEELASLGTQLAARRGPARERALADHLAGALARAVPRLSLRAPLAAPRLWRALEGLLDVLPGRGAVLEASTALRPGEAAAMHTPGGPVLRADLALGRALGLAVELEDAELELTPDDDEARAPRVAGRFFLARLPLPFGLPALSDAEVTLETQVAGADLELAPGGLTVVGERAGERVELRLESTVDGPALVGAVEHSLRLSNLDLGPIHVPGTELSVADRIRLETRLDAVLDLELCAARPRAVLTGELEWNGWTWGVPPLELDLSVRGPRELREALAAHVRAHAAEIFAEAFDDLDYWLASIRSGAIELDDQGAPNLARVLEARGHAVDEVARVLQGAGFQLLEVTTSLAAAFGEERIEEIARAVRAAFGDGSLPALAQALKATWGRERMDELATALRHAYGAHQLERIARALERAYGRGELGALAGALGAAFGPERDAQVAGVLLGGRGAKRAEELALALRAAWGEARADEQASALRTALGARADARPVARALCAAYGPDATELVARALKAAYGPRALERVAAALVAARGPAALDATAAALRAAWRPSRRSLAQALRKACGADSATAVAQALLHAWAGELSPRQLVTTLRQVYGAGSLANAALAARRALGRRRLDAVGAALRQAYPGARPNALAGALRDAYGASRRDEVGRALARAGFGIDEVARALKSRFRARSGAELLEALAAAGFPWKDVVHCGTEALGLAPELVAGWSLARSGANGSQTAARLRDLGYRLDDVTWALYAGGASALDTARAAKTSFGADARAAAVSLGTCDAPAGELASALREVHELDADAVASALAHAGYEPGDVAQALKATGIQAASEAARALRAAGLKAPAIAGALDGPFARRAQELAEALRAAGFDARAVARTLAAGHAKRPETTAAALVGAGFGPEETARGLRGLYPGGASAVARAMKAAGLEAEPVREALVGALRVSEARAESCLAEVFKR